MGYVWKKLANDWNTLTPTDKENLFVGTNYIKASIQQLLALNEPFKIAAYSGDSVVPNTYVNAVPFGKLFVPNAVFGDTFDSIDSISPVVDSYGGDVALAHFDTDYKDSITGLNWAQTGNVPIDTTITKFGDGSLSFDGTSYIYSQNNKQDFNFADKDFSIEMWIYPTDNTTRQTLFSFSTEFHGVAVDMFYNGANNVNMWFSSDGASWNIADANTASGSGKGEDNTIILNSWNHVALTRYGKNIILYVNGSIACRIEAEDASMYFDETDRFIIGAWCNGGNLYKGYMDELRIAKGLSHYTSIFTPATSEFSSVVDMPKLKFMITKNLVDYYTFDESLVTKTTETKQVDKTILNLDGSDDYITIPASVLGGKREFTVEADIVTTTIAAGNSHSNNPAIFGFDVGGAGKADFGVQIKNGYLCWFSGFTSNNTDKYGTTSKFIADGNKHNIAITCDGNLINIYVDRQRVARTTSENIPMANNNIYIGYTSVYCNMKVYEVRLWSVARFYKYLGKEIKKTAKGLEAWYLPEEIVGSTFYDKSEKGNNATLTGSPTTSTQTVTVTIVTETSGFTQINPVTAENVLDVGMTAETLSGISETQWDLFFSGTGGDSGIGIGFAMIQDSVSQLIDVDNMTVYVDMKGEWLSSHKGIDFEYGYPNNNLLRVQLLTDGDFKINYSSSTGSGSGGGGDGGSTTAKGLAVNWTPETEYEEGQIILHDGTMYVASSKFKSGQTFSETNLTSYGGIPLTTAQINAIAGVF